MSFTAAHSDAKRDTYAYCDYLSYTNTDSECHRDTYAQSNGYTSARPSPGIEYLDQAAG